MDGAGAAGMVAAVVAGMVATVVGMVVAGMVAMEAGAVAAGMGAGTAGGAGMMMKENGAAATDVSACRGAAARSARNGALTSTRKREPEMRG